MKDTQFAGVKIPKCLEWFHNTYDRSPTTAEYITEPATIEGMGTVARMTRVRPAAKNASTHTASSKM